MNLKQLNFICSTICIVSTIAGVVFALILIWGDIENEIAWKGLGTVAVFFMAGTLTLGVNQMLQPPRRPEP